MKYSFTEIVSSLLSGATVSWPGNRTNSCQLETPLSRRLFEFLLTLAPETVAAPDETIFGPLMEALDKGHDPRDELAGAKDVKPTGPWRLARIETENFGGLNLHDGDPFVLRLTDTHLSLEGYNGSGKTSLVSAILWALTGYKALKQDAPVFETGKREAVYDSTGKKVGDWPPLVVYPTKVTELKQTACARVRLEFEGPNGKVAVAERRLTSPENGEPTIEAEVDSALLTAPQLVEAGLLMPARLPHVAFGDKDKSEALHEAIKIMTGLDQLADIAIGVGTLRRSNGKFLKYAKDKGAERYETAYASELERTREAAQDASFEIPEELQIDADKLDERLQALIDNASTLAAAALSDLSSQIDPELDLESKEDRDKLQNAVSAVRYAVNQQGKDIELFSVWKVLTEMENDDAFAKLPDALDEVDKRLGEALAWHDRQQKDEKLRLKALASRYFIEPVGLEENAACPLCDTKLTSEEQRKLAEELAQLKAEAHAAERTLEDACSDLDKAVREAVPAAFSKQLPLIAAQTPLDAFTTAMREKFAEDDSFAGALIGFVSKVDNRLKELTGELPNSEAFEISVSDEEELSHLRALRRAIAEARHGYAIAVWWSKNSEAYRKAWASLIGRKDEDGAFPDDSLNGMLIAFEQALATAGPLDKIAAHLEKAKQAASTWKTINEVQQKRQAIADALEPLRDLSGLVDHVTKSTLSELSGRMSEIVEAISIRDQFVFDQAKLANKAVTIDGAFAENMVIDATLVANTSWLRGILWAFVFALRERCVRDLGIQVMPLMLLDDPQMTFDATNERLWARDLARRCGLADGNEEYIQLLLATHSRRFFTILTKSECVPGECGKLVGPTGGKTYAAVINGTQLDQRREKAIATKDPDDCAAYIGAVRVYTEDLLRIMLRGQASDISGDSLTKLIERLELLRKDSVQPFTQTPFKRLIDALNPNDPIVILIQKPHHEDDGTISYGDFESVLSHWNKRLGNAIDHAFALAAEHASYSGNSQYFPWSDNVVELPISQKDNLSSVKMNKTGVAAAASTDGRIGDGVIDMTEEAGNEDQAVRLHNHSAYQLTVPTLSPVAEPGDVLLVRNYGEPAPRNLVVAAHGDRLLARRLNDAEGHTDVSVLTGQSGNPYELPEAAIALKEKLEPRKIIGTLFTSGESPNRRTTEDEVVPVEDFSAIKRQVEDARLLKVSGQSMEPIALDGQYVLVKDETVDATSLAPLEGKLVIAISSSGATFFKRLRLKNGLAVLESVNSNYSSGTELLSLSSAPGFDTLEALWSVRGVLFEDP